MWIYDDGRVRGRVEGDAFVTFDLDTLAGLNETYQIAFTWELEDENVAVQLFVDGELRDQDLEGTWVEPGDTLFIGGGDGVNHLANGIFDEFRVYDAKLSEGEILFLYSGAGAPGDFNGNGTLDAGDLDEMAVAMGTANVQFDLDNDDDVDIDDRLFWVNELSQTWIGDSNLDGEFNSSDFVQTFQRGKYETAQPALWGDGDWNGDQMFDSSDFVLAFQAGGYEQGPRAAVNSVPEPSSMLVIVCGLLGVTAIRQRE